MDIQFLFIYDSIIAMIEIITAGFITWYIVRLRHKSRATWWFAGFFCAIIVVCVGFFLETSIVLFGDLFYPLQVVAGVSGQACLIQFAYHFPANDQPREARLVRYISLGVVLVIIAAAAHYIGMFFLAPLLTPPPALTITLMYIILPIGIISVVSVLLRRTLHLAQRDIEARQHSLLDKVHVLIHPPNKDAAVMRTFIGVILLGIIPTLSSLLLSVQLIPIPIAAYFSGLGILLMMVSLFLVYLHSMREPSSFIARIFSVSLVMLLALFGIVALITTSARNEQFRQKRLWQIAMVQQTILRDDLKHLPGEVAYIAAAPLPPEGDTTNPVYTQQYPLDKSLPGGIQFIAAEDRIRRETGTLLDYPALRTLDYVRELTSVPDWSGILRYADHSIRNTPRYVAYRFVERDRQYEIGFRLTDDIRYVNQENVKLIALLIASSFVLWLALPLFFRVSLVKPLNTLLDGVRRADAGDLHTAIPVHYEDEIGYLTRSFNRMVATVREATTRLEQHVSERTTDLARVNNRLIEEMSRRKRIEVALRESEEKYRNVSERANDGIIIVQDELIQYCNARLAEMLAYPVDQIEGTSFDFFLAPESVPIVQGNLAKRLRGEAAPSRYEVVVLTKTEQRLEVEINAGLMEYEEHPAVLAFVRDISERKQAEAALRAREEQYRLLAENMYDVVWTLTLDGRFTYVSPSVYYLRGYTAEEVLQQSMHEALTPDSLQRVLYGIQESIQQGTLGVERVELEQPCKDGSTVWTECITTPLLDVSGNLSGWVGVSRDISERKQTAAELQRAKEAAEAANNAKSVFLANMSHELRTPLNAILGFAQIMRRSHSLPAEHREQVGIIYRSGEHLLNLINSVLDVSKIEAGRMTLTQTNFDLYRLLHDLDDMFRLRVQEKGLLLNIQYAPDVPQYVSADEVKLRQVLINLLSNAVKFTTSGAVTLRVSAHACQHSELPTPEAPAWKNGDAPLQHALPLPEPHSHNADEPEPSDRCRMLRFDVEDTGPGIAADDILLLFEAFTQTRTGQETQGGTGLGLAISRKFVQMMGGDISVSSEIGQGSIFTFDIVAAVVSVHQVQYQRRPGQVVGLAPDQSLYRILVVDDQPDIRALMTQLLAPTGFVVREASNGQEALEVWEDWAPQLIWMDMRMPEMDGYEATRRIKATVSGQQTVIVALTASAFDEEQHIVFAAGCDDFVRKPFQEATIFEVMRHHLGVHYIYAAAEEDTAQTARPKHRYTSSSLSPEALTALPPALLVSLRRAALLGDIDMMAELIEQIRTHNTYLADGLAELAATFQYDQLFLLIEGAASSDE